MPSEKGCDASMWNSVGGDWVAAGRQRLWRTHSDWITGNLIARWMPEGSGAVLKTDLFDEALSGGLFDALNARAETVHGIDLAQETARAAQARHPDMEVRVADVRRMPFDAGTFDTVVSTSTLDHFDTKEEIDRSLREIRRVTLPGGRLILTLDNPLNPKLAIRALLDTPVIRGLGIMPYRYGKTLGPRSMKDAVERAGFDVIDTAVIVHSPRVGAVLLGDLLGRLGVRWLEAGYLASLRPFEALEHLPTRYITGHFCALVAEARD